MALLFPTWKTHLTSEEAIAYADSRWYEKASPREIVEFQLYEPLLCMPLELFQAALEQELGRLVQTGEFSPRGWGKLQGEFEEKVRSCSGGEQHQGDQEDPDLDR